MSTTKVLITVKTYPSLSSKYDELVCTAGLTEEGKWIRIYPIPFRKLEYESQYSKYQWLELELEKNLSDPRPESFKPRSYNKIKLGEKIDTEKGTWAKRKEIVLKNVHTNLAKLIKEAKTEGVCTSLAIFKPRAIQKFKIEPVAREWDVKKLAQLEAKANQLNMFADSQNPFKVVDKLPYKFSYEFIDDEGTVSTLMIEDWEIGQIILELFKNA